MSGSEWAAIVGAQVCLVLLVVLVVMIVRLDRTTRELRTAAAEFRRESGAALRELREAVRAADYELDRVDALVTGAERVTDRVDAASALADRVITSPVVKAMAVGTGTRRAVQRLRGQDARNGQSKESLMFKRATWLTVGFGLGVGTTVAAARQVRKRVNRYQPGAVANRVTDSSARRCATRSRRRSTRAASAAAARESELRARPLERLTPKPWSDDSRRGRYDLSRGGAPNG